MARPRRAGRASRVDHDAAPRLRPMVRRSGRRLTLTGRARRAMHACHDSVTKLASTVGGMPRFCSASSRSRLRGIRSRARPNARVEHPRHMTTREIVTAYLRAVEAQDTEAAARYLHPEVELTEHPNRVSPAGMRADLAGMRAAGERGRQVMASQRYEIRGMIIEGD